MTASSMSYRRKNCWRPGLTGVVMLCGAASTAFAAPGDTELVSVVADGSQAAGDVNPNEAMLAVSADGRYVAFLATGLQPGPTPDGGYDVYLRDRSAGTTELISVGLGGVRTGGSFRVSMSADARYVAFASVSSRLVANDTNGRYDMFVRDRLLQRTERVAPPGVEPNDNSWGGHLSSDGRFLAFVSAASNLVAGDTNGTWDAFVLDRQSGQIERVSVDSSGSQGNDGTHWANVSDDGRYVAFNSFASNLVAGDTNGFIDVFVRDRQLGQTRRINLAPDKSQATRESSLFAMSPDGRYVVFDSAAPNLVAGDTNRVFDAFLWDAQTDTVERVSVGPGGQQANLGGQPQAVSADGRYVLVMSWSSNLVPGDTLDFGHLYVHDRVTGENARASVTSGLAQANESTFDGTMTPDGSFVAFTTAAINLSGLDKNDTPDAYLHEMGGTASVYAYTVKPQALAFGEHPVGSATTLALWLRNKGTTELPVQSISLRGVDRAQFRLSHRCGAIVAAGAGCAIHVTFAPTTVGAKTAKVRVEAGAGALRIVGVSATGAAPTSQ